RFVGALGGLLAAALLALIPFFVGDAVQLFEAAELQQRSSLRYQAIAGLAKCALGAAGALPFAYFSRTAYRAESQVLRGANSTIGPRGMLVVATRDYHRSHLWVSSEGRVPQSDRTL